MRIALRVPGLEAYRTLLPWKDGTRGRIPFIFYSNLESVEQMYAAGATKGDNPAELGVLVACNGNAPRAIAESLPRYIAAEVTYIMQDCERGPDNLWREPDVPAIAAAVAPLLRAAGRDFRWNVAMQFGYVENTYGGVTGDRSVCRRLNARASCDLSQSYAAQVWQHYDDNDIYAVFGELSRQESPDQMAAANAEWLDYVRAQDANASWWAVSRLVDRRGTGQPDLSPAAEVAIAERAAAMGAEALLIIYLGRSAADLVSRETQMDRFLDLWAQAIAN
jgi:hypothetical protein